MAEVDSPLAPPRRPALLAGAAAVFGAALGVILDLSSATGWILFGLGAAVGFAAAWLAGRRVLPAAVLVAASLVAIFAGYAALSSATSRGLAAVFPEGAELVRVRGVIVEGGDYVQRDPALFEYPDAPEGEEDFPVGADPRRSVSWLLRVESLPDLGREASGFIKLYTPPQAELELFSTVEVVGKLRRPRRAGNPGEVDSREIYARKGISHTLAADEPGRVKVLDRAGDWDPRRFAPWVHRQFHQHIGSRMSRNRAAILGATLLGERGNLSAAQRAKFVRSGTVHLLVVSGLHVGLLAGAVLLIFRALGFSRAAWGAAAVASVVYLLVTGVQPSVLRATIMVVIYALGKAIVRRPDALNVLGASALVSLVINPLDVADLGFQLSFLAVLGILVVAPALRLRRDLTDSERITRRWYESLGGWAGASLRISMGVGVATWPLLAYTVHIVAPSMFVTNLVAAPLLTVMLGVALFAPLAVVPGLGAAIAWVLSQLAGVLDLIAGTFAEIPFGHLFLPAPPVWWLIGYYAALIVAVRGPRWRLPRAAGAVLWIAWLGLIPAGSLLGGDAPGPARMTALDVGQGQCVVVEVPGGPCAVLDCGSTSVGAVGERILAPYLWSRGRRRIDVLFVSHADADHVNGLPQVFERFSVGRTYVSELFAEDATGAALKEWLAGHTDVRTLARGDSIELAPGLDVRCIGPDAGFVTGLLPERLRRNEGSLVLELTAGPTRVLLPSDAETPGLAAAVPHLGGTSDILFAPHQGSRVEGLRALLETLAPKHVVVSARGTFPAAQAMNAYARAAPRVWRTWDHGAVTFEMSADGSLDVQTFLAPP